MFINKAILSGTVVGNPEVIETKLGRVYSVQLLTEDDVYLTPRVPTRVKAVHQLFVPCHLTASPSDGDSIYINGLFNSTDLVPSGVLALSVHQLPKLEEQQSLVN